MKNNVYVGLLFFAICLTGAHTSKALEVTDTLILKSGKMLGEPFGLTSVPDTFYAYFSYDDSYLNTTGIHQNILSNFELTIGDAQWLFDGILNNTITVEGGKVVDFFLDLVPSAPDSNKKISISPREDNIHWHAYDTSARPNPEVSGTYSIVQGRIEPDMLPVPEPATMLLFGTGLVGLAGISIKRRKK